MDGTVRRKIIHGNEVWFLGNMIHREDGPAIISGDGRERWFIGGKEFEFSTIEDLQERIKLFNISFVMDE